MFRRLVAAVALSFGLVMAASAASQNMTPSWLVGAWTATSDEDGTPADVFSISADGKFVSYGINCALAAEMPLHIYSGDVYVTSEISGKGPVAAVFRPSRDKKKLTYTSPRTRHNSIYERLPSNPCGKKG